MGSISSCRNHPPVYRHGSSIAIAFLALFRRERFLRSFNPPERGSADFFLRSSARFQQPRRERHVVEAFDPSGILFPPHADPMTLSPLLARRAPESTQDDPAFFVHAVAPYEERALSHSLFSTALDSSSSPFATFLPLSSLPHLLVLSLPTGPPKDGYGVGDWALASRPPSWLFTPLFNEWLRVFYDEVFFPPTYRPDLCASRISAILSS